MNRAKWNKALGHCLRLGLYIDGQKESPERDQADGDLAAITGLIHEIETEPYQGDLFKDWRNDENYSTESD